MFLEEVADRLEKVREAVRVGAAARLRLTAHALRGLIGHFSTGAAYQAATRLEQFGIDGNLTEAPRVHADLEETLAALRPALAAFASGLGGEIEG
jgi:hypothetical protein